MCPFSPCPVPNSWKCLWVWALPKSETCFPRLRKRLPVLSLLMRLTLLERKEMGREELENKIATYTGGRAAEEIVFGSETTGAANDIEQATKLARAMITRYGMNREFDMVALETQTNQYLGGDTSLACSAETQREVDKKVVELVKRQHEKADTGNKDPEFAF